MKRTTVLLVFIFSLLLLADNVTACPMCQGGSGGAKTLNAYRGTTIFLALLPLAGAGGIFYWLKKRHKKTEDKSDNPERI